MGEWSSKEHPVLSWQLENKENEVLLFWVGAPAYAWLDTSATVQLVLDTSEVRAENHTCFKLSLC